jgi:alginate O-acetyltransferase complex protein AlgI
MDFFSEIFTYSEDAPMLFTRFYFWGFFFVLLLFYSFLYKRNYLRNAYLFFMSLFFYYKSGGYFFSLLIFSTIADYILGHLIYGSERKNLKKLFLTLSIFINIGLLAWFKYAWFLTELLNRLTGLDLATVNYPSLWYNQITGSDIDIFVIMLPVGISFYTFQTISYTVDVYRQKLKPVKNIIDFGFYVSFFPQLVAGPIVRAADFIPQLYGSFRLSMQEMGYAVFLIVSGLIKKMIISDYISINFVDRVFDNPLSYTGFENLMAVYGYSVQIYCDFSGYTDIAIGVALLLGFKLPINFNSPYKAQDIGDFWRRWHISLSSWLRDYLYIPIGGNRKGVLRTYANLLVTMLLGGLWHGAGLQFIIWGGLHGAALAFHKLWRNIVPSVKAMTSKTTGLIRFFSIFITFQFVSFAWIPFRSENMLSAGDMLSRIFYSFGGGYIPQVLSGYKNVFLLMLFALVIHWLPSGIKEYCRGAFIRSHTLVKIVIVVMLVFVIYQVRSAGIQPFIYFQF